MGEKLLIAGGGTGGHIFPGIAIAEEWQRRGGEVVFVGTPTGQEGQLVPKHGFALELLKVGSLKGAGLLKKMKTLLGLPRAFLGAYRILRREQPRVVLGIGGYASGPMCLTAVLTGRRTAITDQNVQPGMTNRILGKIVDRIFLSFAGSAPFFPNRKILVTGNPVRSQITQSPYAPPANELNIFIFGGSQGAVTLNENVIKAIDLAKDLWPRFKIAHQSGKTDHETLTEFYRSRGLNATVSRFFDNMNELYAQAHVVICRSGAGTMTELALAGRPALFVPYPFAADNHQAKNAELFVKEGAAWMIEQKDLSPEKLAELFRSFLKDPEQLAAKAEAVRHLAKPTAAKEIVDQLME